MLGENVMKNSPKQATVIPVRKSRKTNKKSRGFGMGQVESLIGVGPEDVITWCQTRDPLFKIKGKERHRILKGM
jgi:hypothetical protein